jgi:hypothetical protein
MKNLADRAVRKFIQERIAALQPGLGMMSGGEWQRRGYLRADHHLRQFGV